MKQLNFSRRLTHVVVLTIFAATSSSGYAAAPQPEPSAVYPLTQISATRAAVVVRRVFSDAHIVVDDNANAIVVRAPQPELDALHSILTAIDTKNPFAASSAVIPVAHISAARMAAVLGGAFPHAHVRVASKSAILVTAMPAELTQMQSIASSLDTPPAKAETTPASIEVVHLVEAPARDVARKTAATVRGVHISVAGSSIIVSGPPDLVTQAKAVIASLDHPGSGSRFEVLYRPRQSDVAAVVALLSTTFPNASFKSQPSVGVFTVLGTAAEQHRISEALTVLESSTTGLAASGAGAAAGPGPMPGTIQIYDLKAALPGANGGASTTAADLSATVLSALGPSAPDLHITALPNEPRLILTGSSESIAAAESLLKQLDISRNLIVLDTQILDITETSASDLGLSLPTPVLSTTFTEIVPAANAAGAATPFTAIQPFTRTSTPLSIGAQLNLLVQKGNGKVLANPRITTVSGRTATIRAGDTLSVETTAGGSAGTVATTQLQTFQTGVTLDITPILNADNNVSVTLHPTVNDVAGYLNGIPQIETRDTETTVSLHEDQTLIIGGLIQESHTYASNRIPVLGSLPLVGSIFRESQKNSSRTELVITVTPHIIHVGGAPPAAVSNAIVLPVMPAAGGWPKVGPLATPEPAAAIRRVSAAVPAATPRRVAAATTVALAAPVADAHAALEVDTPVPNPRPSALNDVNRYVYGKPPENNFAKSTDSVQIFYANLSPTVLKHDTPATLHVVTTTNAEHVAIAVAGGSYELKQTAPGEWTGTFSLGTISSGLPSGETNLPVRLSASHHSGSTTTVTLPVSLI